MAELLVTRRVGAVAAALTAAAFAVPACTGPAASPGGPGGAVGPEVVATVADSAITVEQVRALLPAVDGGPLVRIAGVPAASPARDALDGAVRDELLAREATRRGLDGSRADRIAALVRQEAARAGTTPDKITESDARAWHAAHREVFDTVHHADVAWAEISVERVALDLLDRAAGLDEPAFLRLVRGSLGVVRSGAHRVDDEGGGVPGLVTRAAFAVRAAGGVGLAEESGTLAEQAGTRRWWLVRVDAVEFERTPWSTAVSNRVRAAMAWQHQQDQLDRLARSLRQEWPVRVYEERLDAVGP